MKFWPTRHFGSRFIVGIVISTALAITLASAVFYVRKSSGLPVSLGQPLAAFAVPLAVFYSAIFFVVARANRSSARVAKGCCVSCGYPVRSDLLVPGDRCNECGMVVTQFHMDQHALWRANRCGLHAKRSHVRKTSTAKSEAWH